MLGAPVEPEDALLVALWTPLDAVAAWTPVF